MPRGKDIAPQTTDSKSEIKPETGSKIELQNDGDDNTTYAKGKELEEEFASFMRNELGWPNVRVQAHLYGKSNRKGAAVDVIAHRLDNRGVEFKKLFKVFMLLCFALIGFGFLYGAIENWEDGIFYFCVVCGALFEIGAFIAMALSDKLNKENALVECKNLKSKTNITHINKSLNEIKDYRASGDKEYKFTHHYFVSASGFMENALKHAQDSGIICYEKKDGSFIKTEYWNNLK